MTTISSIQINDFLRLDLLEKTVPASKVFEGEGLLPFEVKSSIEIMLADLNEFLNDDYDDIDSHLQRFQYVQGESTIESWYDSPLDLSRKLETRQPVKTTFIDFTLLKEETLADSRVIRQNAARELIRTLNLRFQSLNEDVFTMINWCDPQNWSDE